jgi:hypothetical protein
MDFKAKMATGAISLGAGNQIINALADLVDAWTNKNSPVFEMWTVDQWQVVLAIFIGAALGGPFLVFSEFLRQSVVKFGTWAGYDFSKALGNGAALLLCLALSGCASPFGQIGEVVNCKGGGTFVRTSDTEFTMSCSGDMKASGHISSEGGQTVRVVVEGAARAAPPQ